MDDLCWLYRYTPDQVRDMALADITRLHARAKKAAEPPGGD